MIKKILLIIITVAVLAIIVGAIMWRAQRNKIPFLPGKSIPINTSIEADLTGE